LKGEDTTEEKKRERLRSQESKRVCKKEEGKEDALNEKDQQNCESLIEITE